MPGHLLGGGWCQGKQQDKCCCTYGPTCNCIRFKNQKNAGCGMHAFNPNSQGTVGPQDTVIPYAEETGTHWEDTVGLPDSARQSWACWSEMQMWIWVQRSLGESSIHRQSHWHHACSTHFSWRLQPPPSVRSVPEAEPGLVHHPSFGDGV